MGIGKGFAVLGISILAVMVLSACADRTEPMPDQVSMARAYTPRVAADTDQKWSGQSASSFTYDPSTRHDAFKAPEPVTSSGSGEKFDLDQMRVLGVIRGTGADTAYIMMPDGSDRIVKVNDVLGRNQGKVVEISRHSIVVEETMVKPEKVLVIRRTLQVPEVTER